MTDIASLLPADGQPAGRQGPAGPRAALAQRWRLVNLVERDVRASPGRVVEDDPPVVRRCLLYIAECRLPERKHLVEPSAADHNRADPICFLGRSAETTQGASSTRRHVVGYAASGTALARASACPSRRQHFPLANAQVLPSWCIYPGESRVPGRAVSGGTYLACVPGSPSLQPVALGWLTRRAVRRSSGCSG